VERVRRLPTSGRASNLGGETANEHGCSTTRKI
jgi:hypothetical protein